jgi:sterol desaturase/sphingolipid hydroxylase (fatty acid hydroxylase superfamily)
MKMLFATLQRAEVRAWLGWLKEVMLGLVTTRMSAVAFHLDYFLYPPAILASLLVAVRGLRAVEIVALALAGFAVWTLAEYLLHRFVLHHWPYFSKFHQAHHDEPRAMIGSPTLFTLLLFFAATFVPTWLAFGSAVAGATFAGFLIGYLCFAGIHEIVHHSESQNRLMRYFKKLHAIHHHGDTSKNFGVITSFWDHVFGTYEANIKRPHKS